MNASDDPDHNHDHGTDPTKPFELVSNEIRVGILQALATRQREAPRNPTLGFADLRRRVGTRDSGQFNYHLQQLRGRFIERTEAGYKLTYLGLKLVSTILAGTYEPRAQHEREPVALDEPCPVCDEPLTAAAEDGLFRVSCPNDHAFQHAIPPGATADRTMDEAIALLTRRSQQDLELAAAGICPLCYDHIEWAVRELDDLGPMFEATCGRCGIHIDTAVGPCVLRHPAVVSFYYDHGIDIRERPHWTLAFCTDPPTVLSEDPLQLRIDIRLGNETLRLTVDDAPSVTNTERRQLN